MPEKIIRWKAIDGKEFDSEAACVAHEEWLSRKRSADEAVRHEAEAAVSGISADDYAAWHRSRGDRIVAWLRDIWPTPSLAGRIHVLRSHADCVKATKDAETWRPLDRRVVKPCDNVPGQEHFSEPRVGFIFMRRQTIMDPSGGMSIEFDNDKPQTTDELTPTWAFLRAEDARMLLIAEPDRSGVWLRALKALEGAK